ncbi:hypothetical protein ACFVUS_02490 [Nocardia sp. NPDC058058]|uniref:phthiocerol/phthiodiolone dimycocerosyl transferase family protein n=1 Tax=Nocardia sp. NPDC058058 TaxID=3346317 RepID=UPI0036D890FB
MSVGRVRSLAPSELVFAMAGAYIGYRVRVRGELNIPALSVAFAGLRRKYPVLSAVLEPEDRGYAIVAGTGPLPGIVVSAGDIDAPIPGVCGDQSRALSGLHVAHDSDRAAVTLFTHHSIADGYHSLELLAELWSLYVAGVSGEPMDLSPWDYPESLERVLADRGITKADKPVGDAPSTPTTDAAAGPPARVSDAMRTYTIAAARCRLDAETTSGLLARARKYETTLNGVVSAVILRVEAELRQVPGERLSYTYAVNLRDRITPPVPKPAATNPLGFASFVPSGDLGDTATVARAVTEELRKGLDNHEVHQAGLGFFDTMSAGFAALALLPESERPVVVISSNWGVVRTPRVPGLDFEDFTSVMFEPRTDPDSPIAPPGTYVLSTFGDRLSIELRSAHAPDDARQRIAAIESGLRALDGA